MTTTIAVPGLVHDMDDLTYHRDPVLGGSLSSTFARLLTDHVPAKAHALRSNRKPTKAMNLGKAVHRHALGAGPNLVVWQNDGRTKAGKAERAEMAPLIAIEAAVAVTEAEAEQILDMAKVLREHDDIRHILATCMPEVSGFWQENDVWCRARYDLLGDHAWDYKTAQDVTRKGFARSLANYGYHQQADLYLRGLRAIDHRAGSQPFRFICQETTAPYLVQIHEPDDEAMRVAEVLNDRALELYAEAQRTGTWRGYDSLYAEKTALPNYYFYAHEDELPDEWSPSAELELTLS